MKRQLAFILARAQVPKEWVLPEDSEEEDQLAARRQRTTGAAGARDAREVTMPARAGGPEKTGAI